jgi:hypothetical protein
MRRVIASVVTSESSTKNNSDAIPSHYKRAIMNCPQEAMSARCTSEGEWPVYGDRASRGTRFPFGRVVGSASLGGVVNDKVPSSDYLHSESVEHSRCDYLRQ